MSLHAINRFKIAESFPEGTDEISYADLSLSTRLQETQLRRILRHAMTLRIFKESNQGLVGHTSASKMLTHPNMHEWCGLICEEMWPAATKVCLFVTKFFTCMD